VQKAGGTPPDRPVSAGSGRKQGPKVASSKSIFQGLPWWVKWIVVPVLVIALFGGLITSVVGFVVGLAFRVLLLVVIISALVFLVRKFTSSSS
jgi:hypothetical protein